MANEPNTPDHRWYERRNNIALSNEDLSRETIFDSGIQKINSWINSQPWGFDYPQLVLDFDNEYYRVDGGDTTFANAITHTRASTATYVDSTGTLQTAAINQPRRGHHVWNGTAWVNEGLLHESEARTNLITYSEDLSNAAWTKSSGVTIGTPVTRKGISLDLIENDGANNFRDVIQSFGSVSNGASATFSVFVEAGTSTGTAIRIDDALSGPATARVTVPITWASGVPSLQSAITLGATFVSASIEDFADGLYRISLTIQNTTGGTLTFQARYYVQWDEPAAAVNTYAGGFQAEIAPTPSSYIPTAGSTVTRAADVLTVPAANLPYPEPVVIGPELVTNGTFDTDVSGWTDNSTGTGSFAQSAGYGVLTTVDSSNRGIADQSFSTVAGKVYRITFSAVSSLAGNGSVFIGTSFAESQIATLAGYGTLSQEDFEIVFVASSATTYLRFIGTFNAGTISLDNVSVREINPLALSIQMDGAINFADEGLAAQQTFLRWQLDTNNLISVDLDTDSTATGEINFNQASSGVFDTVATSGTALAPSIATAFNIASRHGSTFINGALNGTALTADTTPVALANLSASNLNLGFDYMGTIKTLRLWGQDVGNAGISEASS